MRRGKQPRSIAAGALLAAVLGMAPVAQAQLTATDAEPAVAHVTFEQKLGSQLPPGLAFRNSNGEPVTLETYLGRKALLLLPVYYECPSLCTLTLNGLTDVLRTVGLELGRDFEAIVYSFDHRETHLLAARKKANYTRELGLPGAVDAWHFLVGDKASVETLSQAIGFSYEYIPETDEFAHRAGLLVVTPRGVVSRYFPGVVYDPRDVRLGLVEASEERIGTVVDRLFLLCYHFDPTAGRYSLAIARVINMACGLTVLIVGGTVGGFLLHERRVARAMAGGAA